MMIVTHSRSTVIIVIRYTYFTQLTERLMKQLTKRYSVDEGQRKRAHVGACTLSVRRTALYFHCKVIIAPGPHKRKCKEKRAGAFTLTLFMPLYFGRISPRHAWLQSRSPEARADHDGEEHPRRWVPLILRSGHRRFLSPHTLSGLWLSP